MSASRDPRLLSCQLCARPCCCLGRVRWRLVCRGCARKAGVATVHPGQMAQRCRGRTPSRPAE